VGQSFAALHVELLFDAELPQASAFAKPRIGA
jgi:hypothetical protein